MTPDPAGLAAVDLSNPQSLNRYAYVLNSPVNFIDPLGLYCGPGSIALSRGGCGLPGSGPGGGASDGGNNNGGSDRSNGRCDNNSCGGGAPVQVQPPVLKRKKPTVDCSKPPDLSALPPTGPMGMDLAKLAAELGPSLAALRDADYSAMIATVFVLFRPGGVLDIKQDVNKRGALGYVFADFGNFNYGAVCSTVMSLTACQSWAGAGQILYAGKKGAPSQGSGIPFVSGCYGDQCWDAYQIAKGYQWMVSAKREYDAWAQECRQ